MPTPTPTLADVRARLEEAMGLDDDGDWLAEACARLTSFRHILERRRLFDVSSVGARIRTAREVKGYTQQQLGARLGLKHASVIQAWEKGERDVPAHLFPRLAVGVGVTPRWLLEGGHEGGPAYGQNQAPRRLVRVGWSHKTRLERRKRIAELELERVRALRMDRGARLPSDAQRAPIPATAPLAPHAPAPSPPHGESEPDR